MVLVENWNSLNLSPVKVVLHHQFGSLCDRNRSAIACQQPLILMLNVVENTSILGVIIEILNGNMPYKR